MKTFLIVSFIAGAAVAPASLHAQSSKPQPSPAVATKTLDAKSPARHSIFRHPNAAQRQVTPSDLVAVTTPSGEKRYARKKPVKTAR